MKLKEVIKSLTWEELKEVFFDFYPDEEENTEEFEQVFVTLNKMEPLESDLTLYLTEFEDEDDTFVHVSGQSPDSDESYSLGFAQWGEWLGMSVSAESLEDFSLVEIAAHSLFEMTFFGLTEEEIKETLIAMDSEEDEIA